jgi:SAM-dependent methyltransferase
MSWETSPFRIDHCRDLKVFREVLDTAGYTQSALAETVRTKDSGGRLDLPVVLRRTACASPYHSFVRLFFLGQAVRMESAEAVLAPFLVEQLLDMGLLNRSDQMIRSEARLVRFEDLVIAHDFSDETTGQPAAPDHVLGVGAASITLANLTPRHRVESVLDLGTGCGIQALLASRHADHVIGVDFNPRALNFAAFNARVNGVTNIELRQGNLYEPVKELQFDLIVTNPPYVISPESQYIYRDSGLPGDAISEQVVRQAPAHLREGGYAIILCNWHHEDMENWTGRPQQWISRNSCDSWLLRFETGDPLTYASTWLRPTESRDPEHYGDLLDGWIAYYDQMRIRLISAGAVTLRRRTDHRNWARADSVPRGERSGACGEQIARIFANQDFTEESDDDGKILDARFVLPGDLRLEQGLQPDHGSWAVQSIRLKLTQGFVFTCEIDWLLSAILVECDGRRSLRDLASELAEKMGLDLQEVTPSLTSSARKCLQYGFLTVSPQ